MKEAWFKRQSIRCAAHVALLAAAVLTGACVTTGNVSGPSIPSFPGPSGPEGAASESTETASTELTPAEQRMREQSRAFQRTVWEGVLIGAGAGTLWGLIQGDDIQDVLKKALIGGAVGGLAGAYVAHVQRKYAAEEDQLDAMITDVRRYNRESEELIANVREVIAEDERRLASVEKRYHAGEATEAELVNTRHRIEDNQAVVRKAAQGAREQYKMFKGAESEFRQQNPGTDTAVLQQELNAYEDNIETLDGLADSISVA